MIFLITVMPPEATTPSYCHFLLLIISTPLALKIVQQRTTPIIVAWLSGRT